MKTRPRDLVASARTLRSRISDALAVPDARLQSARTAYQVLRDDVIRQQLAELPLARLRETTQGRLRLGAIEAAGYRTVGQAAAAGEFELQTLPGVGPQTASQVIAAARQLEAAMTQNVRLRFDPDARPPLQAKLLAELRAYEIARQSISPIDTDLNELAAQLDAVMEEAGHASSRLRMFFSGKRERQEARGALSQLDALMRAPRTVASETRLKEAFAAFAEAGPDISGLWQDYEQRAVAYNGLLIEIGEYGPDHDTGQGFVPVDIAQRVHKHPLDLTLMRSSLRGYQAFGAKFALAQEKAILGDEMGLGKTIEALAAMCHLHMEDQKHFLVVCPASVVVNWTHEIKRHSELRPYRLHGLDRQRNFQAWTRLGGVAVTTYASLRSLPTPHNLNLAMLVADEAHYVKNPAAVRTKAVQAWAGRTGR